ncbi:hypothetical protein IM538_06565 [Cytobacillus suaedae]|nr:hypothetical protein IM538_06565 [Cytobacillus suaedae]
MKKKLITTVMAGALVFSAFAPVGFGHDELGGIGIDKGDGTPSTSINVPVLEGSKNLSNLREVAASELKEINGVKNNAADVYSHKGFAYVGTHTRNGGNGGVRVFDLKDPSNPKEVSQFATDIPGTWQEKVIVKTVSTPEFSGDLAVVSVQKLKRSSSEQGGFLLYDVTDPYNPKKLGFWGLDQRVTGTHELYLTTQGDRTLVLAANPYADYYTHGESKDFQIVDVTNPAEPTTIYQFDPRSLPEVPEDFNGYHWHAPDGKVRAAFNHSTMTDTNGTTALVSFWDLGTIIFDIKDPENPVYLGRTDFASNQQGAAHSAALAKGGNVLIETREVAYPVRKGYEESYGYTRIFDIKGPTQPKLLSEFKTELTDNVEDGNTFDNTVHDPKVHGNTLYLSHYIGGIRAVDITDPSNPVQIAKYVPENADVWGVFVDRNYILASCMNTGLKVLQKNNKVKNDQQR